MLNFRGSLNFDPFSTEILQKIPQFWDHQKSKLFKDNFQGESPPLSNVRYVLTPYPGLRLPLGTKTLPN